MKSIILLFTFLLSLTVVHGQTESINNLDSIGKKDGKWILYLDAQGDKVKDSTTAAYWRYTYYDHGIHIYPMSGFINKNGRIESSTESKETSKIKMLDGEYKCYDSKGRLQFIHIFDKGEYVSYKAYYSSGQLSTYFDYTKHYKDQPHSWYLFTYDKNGKVTHEGWTKKNEKGHWPAMAG